MSERPDRRGAPPAQPAADEAVAWHDVECAGYEADLAVWRELAAAVHGPVLELGAGTGRVALDLAERGREVTALESDPALCRELARRARVRGLRVRVETGDARSFELGRRFRLAIAPMQVAQLLGGAAGREAMLAAVRRHLPAGAVLAIALADPLDGLRAEEALPPLPDVREIGGWVYSSRPVAMRDGDRGVEIDRVREAVSPDGRLHESRATIALDRVDPAGLADQARRRGFREREPRSVPATEAYVGSRVVVLEAR